MADKPPPTAAQVRGAIDAGRGRDKTPAKDPAAAPLGTDSEAAGTPPTAQERIEALAQETDRPAQPEVSNDATPMQRDAGGFYSWQLMVVIMAIAIVIVVAVIASL